MRRAGAALALVVLAGFVTVAEQPNWCRYAPSDVLGEIHLADGHC